ncbi:MAG: amidohydrolase family protein [Planctomycetes bacterium]|nr:amidohydrolase family protein [Planctomycetota bacterium]
MRTAAGRLAVRCIVLDDEHVLEPGEIAWDARGRIVALRRSRRAERDLCLLPGLVDAHAHLQLAPLPATAPRAFVPWAEAVLGAQRGATAASCRRRLRQAVRELLADGATAFGEIDTSGHGAAALAQLPVAGRCYRELTGFHLDRAGSRQLVRERRAAGRGAVAAGLSPHAPYSVAADLFRAAFATGQPLAIHCAETPAEQEFLRRGRGPFRDLLARLGRLPADFVPPGVGAVRWLERLGVLGPRTQLVHCQELERGDAARIAAAGASIVVCPGTIAWFGRTPPPVPAWLAAGIPVGLGTDSRASNDGWSLRGELAQAARLWPGLAPGRLLAMATRFGARALARPGLGRLRRGGRADFVAIDAAARPQQAIEAFVHGQRLPRFVVAGGVRVPAARARR